MSNFDWSNYFNLAENTLKKLQTESAKRTAVSRYYYAAVQATRIFLENKGFNVDKNSPWHIQVVYAIGRYHSEISSKLLSLREARVEVDYYDKVDDLDGKVLDSAVNSKYVLDKLKSSKKP